MDTYKYQYHVYNKYLNLIITSHFKDEEWVIKQAKNVALDYYKLEDRYLQDVKCDFITDFFKESVINLNLLNKI